jgi:hypothetical protein
MRSRVVPQGSDDIRAYQAKCQEEMQRRVQTGIGMTGTPKRMPNTLQDLSLRRKIVPRKLKSLVQAQGHRDHRTSPGATLDT